MKICFVSDLHINDNINTLRYNVLEWALDDAKKKNADVVVCTNGFDENVSSETAKYVFGKISSVGVPAIFMCDAFSRKSYKSIINSGRAALKCCHNIENVSVITLKCKDGKISDDEFEALKSVYENAVVVLNSPVDSLCEDCREKLFDVLSFRPQMHMFCPQGTKLECKENIHLLKSSNPDSLNNEHPCITYYDTEKNKTEYCYYFCPLPYDFNEYIGISCKDILNDVMLATEHNLSYLELPESVLDFDKKKLSEKLSLWRQNGGKCLILNATGLECKDKVVYKKDWNKLCQTVKLLNVDRVNVVLPKLKKVHLEKGGEVLEKLMEDFVKKLSKLPENCEISVENAKSNETHIFENVCDDTVSKFNLAVGSICEKISCRTGISLNFSNTNKALSEWCFVLGDKCISYRMSFEKCKQLTDLFNENISYASFFKEWSCGMVNAGAVILDLKNTEEYKKALNFFASEKNKIIFDLHSHTYYSSCGRDKMEDLIEGAIAGGVKMLGISDHNYGIANRKDKYFDDVKSFAQKYKDKIKILCGIEISVLQERYDIRNPEEIKNYDYCLIEHLTLPGNIVGDDLFGFCKHLGIKCGIAHTNLFEYCDLFGFEYEDFFRKMAENGIFWEMNVNYDSIHGYKKHGYVKEFKKSIEKQQIIKDAGVYVSVGFDSHRIEDYDGYRVREMYDFLKNTGIKTADLLF